MKPHPGPDGAREPLTEGKAAVPLITWLASLPWARQHSEQAAQRPGSTLNRQRADQAARRPGSTATRQHSDQAAQ
ncbi:unnamed protein product [Gadus morhua 'NCC']